MDKPKKPEPDPEPKKPAKKAMKAETYRRVDEVFRILLQGGEFHDIQDYAKGAEWGVSDSQLRRYMTEALALCATAAEKNRDIIMGRHLLTLRAILARAMEAGDWRAALAGLKHEAELLSLFPVKLTAKPDSPLKGILEAVLRGTKGAQIAERMRTWEPPMLQAEETESA